MSNYNRFHEYLGSLTRLAGIGATAYGLITQDMETIAGGVALGYIGNNMVRDCVLADRTDAERQRTKVLQNTANLEKRIKEE